MRSDGPINVAGITVFTIIFLLYLIKMRLPKLMFQIADTNFVHAPNRVPLVFVDVNAVPGSLVTSNGIRVRAATLS